MLRDDMFMLGRDGTVTGNRIAPARSACAVLVGSQNQQREWIYFQQQTISAEGSAGRRSARSCRTRCAAKETKRCTDCHVSETQRQQRVDGQLLMQGTNFVNFWAGTPGSRRAKAGFEAIVVTERDEPQAVIGSHLHQLAFPANYEKYVDGGRELHEVASPSGANALDIQVRGEYLYVALGPGGFRVYDIAFIDNKGFSERIVTAPVSPLGSVST